MMISTKPGQQCLLMLIDIMIWMDMKLYFDCCILIFLFSRDANDYNNYNDNNNDNDDDYHNNGPNNDDNHNDSCSTAGMLVQLIVVFKWFLSICYIAHYVIHNSLPHRPKKFWIIRIVYQLYEIKLTGPALMLASHQIWYEQTNKDNLPQQRKLQQ